MTPLRKGRRQTYFQNGLSGDKSRKKPKKYKRFVFSARERHTHDSVHHSERERSVGGKWNFLRGPAKLPCKTWSAPLPHRKTESPDAKRNTGRGSGIFQRIKLIRFPERFLRRHDGRIFLSRKMMFTRMPVRQRSFTGHVSMLIPLQTYPAPAGKGRAFWRCRASSVFEDKWASAFQRRDAGAFPRRDDR